MLACQTHRLLWLFSVFLYSSEACIMVLYSIIAGIYLMYF